MFLCRDCHSKECSQDHFTGSNGPCEGCGKTANCSDCKSYKYKEPEEKRKYGTLPEGDGTHRLCMILYAQEDAAKYIGGSNAPMLHDAADRLLFYEKFVEAVQIYMARYERWLRIKDVYPDLTFGEFLRNGRGGSNGGS